MSKQLLKIKNLKKVYYSKLDEIEAISDVSFDIFEGEFVSIVGPSGCGKSTLLNILTSMDTKTSGEIKLKDNIKLGYMLQSDSLLPWKNVIENATIGLDIKKLNTLENKNYVDYLLNTYGLGEFKNKKTSISFSHCF